MSWIERCYVPSDLAPITTRSERESDSRAVDVEPEAVERIWHAVERLYRSRVHPAIQLSVRRHGEVIIDRSIGHASGNGPSDDPKTPKVLAIPDTPFTIYSASKAVTAMVIHLLDQKGLLHVNDPVVEYIPEFGKHGKDRITIEHVLTHRAGIPNLPPEYVNLDNLADPHTIVQLLCEMEPTWTPGRRLAYHAITGGFVLGEIVRRVTGMDIRQYLGQEILAPLEFRWMNYGVRPEEVSQVGLSYFTGVRPFPPVTTFVRRVLGVDFEEAAAMANEPRFLTGIIPSANIVTTANELGRFYQLLLDGGELDGKRIFERRTINRAISEQSYLEFDLMLLVPLRYSMGFMLGGLGMYGPDTAQSFGHAGFINILSWADPERQVSVALVTSGKPLLYPEMYYLWDIMSQISHSCSKVAARPKLRTRTGRMIRVVPGRTAVRTRRKRSV